MFFAAWLVGRLADLGWDRSVIGTVGAMIIGNLIIYAFGVSWLAAAISADLSTALTKGAIPFLLGDAIKIALAAGIFPSAWWYVNNGRSAGPR
jgi:biotin transport system substrate-specific component